MLSACRLLICCDPYFVCRVRFDPAMKGASTSHGALLGEGVYVTPCLSKATSYVSNCVGGGAILTVSASFGEVLDVGCRRPSASAVTAAKASHDSIYMTATAGADAGSQYCVKDAAKVVVVSVHFVDPARAGLAGFSIGADGLIISKNPSCHVN